MRFSATLGEEPEIELALAAALSSAVEDRWELYPVHALDEQRICACPKRARCESPGKHPTTPHRIKDKDASSDPQRIAQLFARWPGGNLGLRTGCGSHVVALDADPRNCGFTSPDALASVPNRKAGGSASVH